MKIMIVDDNQEMRKFLRTLLERADVEFIECDDGSEAIARFAEALPDWTLMDVRMRQVDGLSATRDIVGRFPQSRIVIITQDINPRLPEAARTAGACGFMQKDDLTGLPQMLGNFSPRASL